MINVEQAVLNKFPGFAAQANLIRKPTLSFLRKIIHEAEINDFLRRNNDSESFDFIDRVFEYFNFTYSVTAKDRANIPSQGRVVIIANHPIGSLDGLALLRLVSEVRGDVKIVASDMLMNFNALESLFIPLDNLSGLAFRRSFKLIEQALAQEQAVIIFPSGEVSRARPTGVKDGRWRTGFLHFARKCEAPILPIFVNAKNSLLFYGASAVFKPLGTAMLAHEMFTKRSASIEFRIGELIESASLVSGNLSDAALVKRIKKHLYKIGKGKRPVFVTTRTVAHPEDRRELKKTLQDARLLGDTRDSNTIYLYDYQKSSCVIKEIGRLREVTFRRVGEGSGSKRDLDSYDKYYRHLVLWDQEHLEIAGAYRIGEGKSIIDSQGLDGLYTSQLFNFSPKMRDYFNEGLELGRSFVNPDYWGKASLDYLWQGIGAYLKHHPEVRYMIGPVSMSATYPQQLRDLLVYYYQRYFSCPQALASARHPYSIVPEQRAEFDSVFANMDKSAAFDYIQQQFAEAGSKIPALYKQYAALFEPDGLKLLTFSVDPDFGNCIDGLFLGDLTKLKATKRKRYIGN